MTAHPFGPTPARRGRLWKPLVEEALTGGHQKFSIIVKRADLPAVEDFASDYGYERHAVRGAGEYLTLTLRHRWQRPAG